MPVEARWVRPSGLQPGGGEGGIGDAQRGDDLGILGLLGELDDVPGRVQLHDPQIRHLTLGNQCPGDGDLGPGSDMVLDELAVVHPVEVVAGQDEDDVPLFHDVVQVLPDGIGRALVPVAVVQGLLGREQVDEVGVEGVEAVGDQDVAVQRVGGELGQDEDAPVAGVDAVGDGHVDQPEAAGDRDGGLAPHLGQRVKAAALASGHDDRDDSRSHGTLLDAF